MANGFQSLPKVFFYTEQIDPTFWNWESNRNVFARNLTEFSGCYARNENISAQLNL